MNLSRYFVCAVVLSAASLSCGKKKKYGDVSASLMKSTAVSSSLAEGTGFGLATSGSTVQSFTPTSLKLPIYRVSLCEGNSSCTSVYTCSANTVAGCSIDLGKIDAFVDALNASAQEIEEGTVINYVSVQYCPDGDTSSIQNITVNGTVKIQGVDYATDPTSGIVAGTSGQDAVIKVKGGCGSFYPVSPAATISKGSATTVKMFFDASYFPYAGTTATSSTLNSFNDDGSCLGSTSAYLCAQVVTIVATIDSGTPTTEQYLVSNIDSSTDNSPTAKVALFYSSSGSVIGGVQNTYRVSGSSVSWGSTAMGGGLGLLPKTVDADTVSFGEPEGSVSLVDWFKNFKRSSHTGTYTYLGSGNVSKDGTYKATKL